MADVAGAGDSRTGENPKVTSKFDRMHGKPRTPGQVASPGGTATPGKDKPIENARHSPSASRQGDEGRIHSYGHDHPAMGGLHRGARARHPTNDAGQDSYEKHGYGGGRGK